jgi:hypothetical protein
MRFFKTLSGAAFLVAMTFGPATHAAVIDIDARANGSYVAGGPANVLPGTTAQPFNPVQITLGAGTYSITNAASTGYYSAWNFQGSGLLSSSGNWVWSFVIAERGGKIIEDAYVNAVVGSQAAMAALANVATYNGNAVLGARSTASFSDTFTLTRTTTLDIYVDDWNWGLGDNYGGVSINIQSAVPESDIHAMLLAGLGLLGFAARRMKKRSV